MFDSLLRGNRILVALVIGCLLLFMILLGLFTELDAWTFTKVVIAALVAVGATLGAGYRRRISRGQESDNSATLLHDITRGDLTKGISDIRESVNDPRMISALRGLVLSLERTIGRFGKLSTDVSDVSEQISVRTRVLGRSAQTQLGSAESTNESVRQIDESIKHVQKSMENLSLNAEETSTSVLEMSASIEEVSRIADTLAEFVDQTASAFEEMSASINAVAQNTESFSSFAIQTASSMVQMNATTQEIGKTAQQSSDLARRVTDSANEGREAVRGSVEGMRKIQMAVDEAKIALDELAQRSQEIGEIVRVIDDIAGQTNLLALNAAIIAAQAGERGKGFAVVADEIRDLSERTSASTDEIRTLIRNVQKSVERAAGQMSASSDRVIDGVGLTERAEQVLDKILELTGRSTESAAGIARATEEQIRGSQAATQAIEEVTRMVQQTATATQDQSVTSGKVLEQTSLVRDYTKHLKRATQEQESGSRAIGKAMDNIMSSVSNVLEATSVLGSESAAIVKAMSDVEQATRESAFTAADLNQVANLLRHGATMLGQELQRFTMATPLQGGHLRTASVLNTRLSLDPAESEFASLTVMQGAIHETLLKFGAGAELVPGVAERWEVLGHGTHYRFYIRQNVKFHNGRPVTASDVKRSYERVMSPEVDSAGAWIFKNVRGSADVFSGKNKDAAGIVAVDDHTLDIFLDEPLAFFLLLLSMAEAAIVPVEETRDRERFRMKPIGAGPFAVEEVVEGSHLKLRRNPYYYAPGVPHLDSVEFRLDLKNFRQFAEQVVAGELDIAHRVPLNYVSQLRNNADWLPYLIDTLQMHTSYIGFDTTHPPFDRAEVRQAMNYAIDRERINREAFSGLGFIANSLLPPGLLGYDASLAGYSHEPERARGLLRQAGYPNGFDVEYYTHDADEFYSSGQTPIAVEDLAAVGIRVHVKHVSSSEARSSHENRGHKSIYFGNWFADFPDPDNFFFIFCHSESKSIPGIFFNSPEIEKKIEQGRTAIDLQERADLYRNLNEEVLRAAPVVFLFHDRFFALHRPELRGVRTYLVPPPVRYFDIWAEK